jgi:hypothetical protein
MAGEKPQNRTLVSRREVIEGLCDIQRAAKAVSGLPDALSYEEVESIGMQASVSAGPEEIKAGHKKEVEAVFNLGFIALHSEADLVTADSARQVLWHRGMNGIVGAALLWRDLRRVRKDIIDSITH